MIFCVFYYDILRCWIYYVVEIVILYVEIKIFVFWIMTNLNF